MFEFTDRVGISAEDAFALVAAFDYTLPRIDRDMRSVSRLDPGPVAARARWREVFTGPGRRPVTVDSEFIEFVPPRSLVVSFATRGVSGTISFLFTPHGERSCDVTVTMHATTRGIGRLLYPVARRDLLAREARRLATFKRLAESSEMSVEEMRSSATQAGRTA